MSSKSIRFALNIILGLRKQKHNILAAGKINMCDEIVLLQISLLNFLCHNIQNCWNNTASFIVCLSCNLKNPNVAQTETKDQRSPVHPARFPPRIISCSLIIRESESGTALGPNMKYFERADAVHCAHSNSRVMIVIRCFADQNPAVSREAPDDRGAHTRKSEKRSGTERSVAATTGDRFRE